MDDYNEANNTADKERFILSSTAELLGPEFRRSKIQRYAIPPISDESMEDQLDPWDNQLDDNFWKVILKEEEERELDDIEWDDRGLIEEEHSAPSIVDLLRNFDPQNPPNIHDYTDRDTALEHLEWWLECEAQQEAVLRYRNVLEDARERRDYSSMGIVQQQIVKWFKPLREVIQAQQKAYLTPTGSGKSAGIHKFGPILCALPADKVAVITAHTALVASIGSDKELNQTNNLGRGGAKFVAVAAKIGQAIEDEVMISKLLRKRCNDLQNGKDENPLSTQVAEYMQEKMKKDDAIAAAEDNTSTFLPRYTNWTYANSHLKALLQEIASKSLTKNMQRNIKAAVTKAREAAEDDEAWCKNTKIQLGAALFQFIAQTATIHDGEKTEFAFRHEKHWLGKRKVQGYVHLNDRLHSMIVDDKMGSLTPITTQHKPMIVPPTPWTACTTKGGYRVLQVEMMRARGSKTQQEALVRADLSTVTDGLNALGRVRWKINKDVLSIAQQCWDGSIALGTDVPSRTDLEVPEEPIQPEYFEHEKGSVEFQKAIEELTKYRENVFKRKRIQQKNVDLQSLRCTALLKLNQAEKFKDFEAIYFPYNVDFRGRSYPVPPHLSNVGSDICRGVLTFADAKPLGDRGLYWLKVHLANFAGNDKISFDERARFVEENMDHVRASASDPLGEDRWWMTLDDPFQGLATCIEIVKAIDSGNPAGYKCCLPVHMDGSCNGLQHYAALGRDKQGGKAVNLCAAEEPQDVYIGVMEEVILRVAEEANRSLDFDASDPEVLTEPQKKRLRQNKAAKLVNGLIDRGVVKRTVMTSVYGVTYVGAREQIQEKIEDKLVEAGYDLDEIDRDVYEACGYLANMTMEVIGDLFSGAKAIMTWLTSCARLITKHGYPVAWISPIGIPTIQPYRQQKMGTLITLMQTISTVEENDNLPIHKSRQVSAFPPNFIHSLDSAHMLLTALEMDRRGLTFSAVHDSFWTHACDVDEMNAALRDVFVDLYSKPLIEDLKKTWELRYPEIEFPDLPERGDLDLTEVKRAPYFFQ